jgi:hypothetical protein
MTTERVIPPSGNPAYNPPHDTLERLAMLLCRMQSGDWESRRAYWMRRALEVYERYRDQ